MTKHVKFDNESGLNSLLHQIAVWSGTRPERQVSREKPRSATYLRHSAPCVVCSLLLEATQTLYERQRTHTGVLSL